MTGEHLPFHDCTGRYCPGSKISEDGRVSPTAFHLRPGESYLSVEWLEFLNQPTRTDEIRKVVKILSTKLRVGASAQIAVTNVGGVCRHVVESLGIQIRFLNEPEPDDPAHSGIHDTDQDEMLIAELIVEKIVEAHPVRAFRNNTS